MFALASVQFVYVQFSIVALWAIVWALIQLPISGTARTVILVVFIVLVVLALIGPFVMVSTVP